MAATIANKDNISLKVVIHKDEKRVVFAEADSNFVETLFSFLTLPMATIVRILGKCPDEDLKPLGSLTNLYQSLVGLPVNYVSAEESKFMMLNARSSSYDQCRKLKLNIDDTKPTKYFICEEYLACSRSHGAYFSTCNVARCTNCRELMDLEIKYEGVTANTDEVAYSDGGVFVSDVATFIITDDLSVMPNTLDSVTQLLCDHGITDASQLEETTFDIGREQILILLKSALLFKNPLTALVFSGMHHIRYSVSLEQGTLAGHLSSAEIGDNAKTMTLKVVTQKSTFKFLFAEADGDFVDFVFGFLEIPLGTVIGKLMNGSSSLRSLDNLFASISNLRVPEDVESQDLKDMLQAPELVQKHLSENQIFPVDVSNKSLAFPKVYLLRQDHSEDLIFSEMHGRHPLKRFDNFRLKDPRIQGKFLKASLKFMLTDDLVITPFSSLSTIMMLNKLKVSMNDIEEHKLNIGIEEGLKILKASLLSGSTLSDALLKEKSPS